MADSPASLAAPPAALPVQAAMTGRLRVLLPVPLATALDYRAAEDAPPPEPGRFVRVNLGPRKLIGVVWDGASESEALPEERLRPVAEVLPTPKLPAELRRFIDRVADYTLAPPGMVLRM